MVSGDAMSTKDKLKSKIMEKPTRSDITFDEMNSFLTNNGFKEKNSKHAGSHRLYEHANCEKIVNIQSKNGLVQKYQVLQVQKIVEEMIEDEGDIE